MRRIQVTDCRLFLFDAASVYAVLSDFESYPLWWPASLRLRVLHVTSNLVGSRFEVRPGGGSFVCEVTQVVACAEIYIRYVDGLHRGTGLWTLKPSQSGTQVCYQIDLEPQGFLPRLLSNVMDFAGIHSRGMENVFDGLQQWLSREVE